MTTQKKKQETSKGIVYAVQIIFCVSMAASYCLPIIFDFIQETALQMFQTTATLTGSVLIGYFGKAGFENYDKNRKLLAFEEEEERKEEGGNG